MRPYSFGKLPKSVLILELAGMVLLTLAWLSLNQYVTLPAPLASPTAGIIMIFAGVLLLLPAAVVLMWGMAKIVSPQLMQHDKPSSSLSDREKKHDDADH